MALIAYRRIAFLRIVRLFDLDPEARIGEAMRYDSVDTATAAVRLRQIKLQTTSSSNGSCINPEAYATRN